MRHWLSTKLLALPLLFLLAVSCAENATRSQTHSSTNAASDGLIITFPHVAGWEGPMAHGVASLNGEGRLVASRCNGCHDMNGTSTVGPPGCRSCHAKYPHLDNWGESKIHVADLATETAALAPAIRTNCATTCHGSDLKGGLSNVSCTECHTQYPHDSTWNSGAGHGARVLGEFPTLPNCKDCHGVTTASPGLAPTCTSCHSDLPDATAAVQHQPSQTGSCTSCHATDAASANGPHLLRDAPPLLCTRCHTTFTGGTTYRHSITQTGDSCLRCHQPHNGSLPHLVKASESELCFSCHNQVITSAQYGTTRNMQAILTGSSNLHSPFQQTDCTSCHNTHGSPNQHLLDSEDPMFDIGINATISSFSCFQCHDYGTYVTTPRFDRPTTIHRPSPQIPTQFVWLNPLDPTHVENLHTYHTAAGLFSCLACHDPHGNNDGHLIRPYLSYNDPGSSSFWIHDNCQGCHTGQLPSGYPNNLW